MAHNMLGTLETPVLAEELVPVPDKQNDAAEIGPAWLHLSRRGLWIALGVSFLLIGAVGVFLPLIPTTGPLIVAAWAFAKGSPALHRWLLSNRLFGPFILEWETYGVIKPRAKLLALGSMGLASAWMAFGADMHWALAALGIGLCGIGSAYVASRPSSHETK
ncbi:YbaN family protein [Pyruvatibacter mobilis]|uniref:YbaN family protein n=1 Tax=Pyruvatibacter mobilis TaxID=1712261 RepID=UPI00042467D2